MNMAPLPALQSLVENCQWVSRDTTHFEIYDEYVDHVLRRLGDGIATVLFRYWLVKSFPQTHHWLPWTCNLVCLLVGVLGHMFMIDVAIYPMSMNLPAHLAGACGLFLLSFIYMLLQTWLTYLMCPSVNGRRVCHIRLIITILTLVALVSRILGRAEETIDTSDLDLQNTIMTLNLKVNAKTSNAWRPATIIGEANQPRSYIIQNNEGRMLKRNRVHLRPRSYPVGQRRSSQSSPQLDPAPSTSSESSGQREPGEFPRLNLSPEELALSTSTPIGNYNEGGTAYTTRSGRVVKPPKRFDPGL
ncbi:K02A2.6-like [Cordylochernes scorpioides]|uniref:K02A2.6-like n=1 Tax=Cordylochernes scorpioides TaxID=51811 RepID=A0ABY6LBG5_9ARAC|nr:K02A2.6-like [Cordylochernes scorpioides]